MWKITLILIAKLTNFIINVFNLGSGFTWPGHIALKLDKNVLKRFNFPKGVILISGTNGKTTTSKLITHLLQEAGFSVTNNETGANLLNGITSAILLKPNSDFGVFEVDENNLPIVLQNFDPNVLVLLNLSRDQLDRYGEVDIILEKWEGAVVDISPTSELVIDGTKEYFKKIINLFPGDETLFDENKNYLKETTLVGKFNAKNVNAAVYSALLVGLTEEEIKLGLKTFIQAYGRGEIIEYQNKGFQLFLAKNPASFNSNLEIVLDSEITFDSVWIIFNDNIPDGRDVSWIYDIEPRLLKDAFENKKILISGTRAYDMGIRLKYSGLPISEKNIEPSVKKALLKFEKGESNSVLVLPNYSAMLEVRKALTGKAIL